MKKVAPVVVLVVFTIISSVLAYEGGFGGLAALRSGWGLQVTLDLCISLFLVGGWIRRDARAQGINPVPYLIALPFLGSIGALLYLVRRNVFAAKPEAWRSAQSSSTSAAFSR